MVAGQAEPDAVAGRDVNREVVPDQLDVELAVRAARAHGLHPAWVRARCVECGWDFPCVTRLWAHRILAAAGWSTARIATLDQPVEVQS